MRLTKFKTSWRDEGSCRRCGFCEECISCLGEVSCIGCGACVEACPYFAKSLREVVEDRRLIEVFVDGERFKVPERITVLKVLELAGFKVSRIPWEGDLSSPCLTGGCYTCSILVDGEVKPACISPVYEGCVVETGRESLLKHQPLRLVSGFSPHPVGGVGTPYWIKPRGRSYRYIEVACFAHGCILRCPTCQNWEITYSSNLKPLTPLQAARMMTAMRRDYRVDRMAISGGECTLNRRWLVEYVKELKRLNQDREARIHVDTNAVVLTPDYIDELAEYVTDIGPDVKGLELSTFMRITGLKDPELAKKLLEANWRAIEYLLNNYYGEMFIGIGVPYNRKLVSMDEIYRIGVKIAGLEPNVQVCVLDYRPEFRRRDIARPSFEEMIEVKRTLEEAGLKYVICQTSRGHVGPGDL